MELFERLTKRAKANRRRIVLPEGSETRNITAADHILAADLADIILLGDPVEIAQKASELNLTHIGKATVIDPKDEKNIDKYAPLFFELRKKKGDQHGRCPPFYLRRALLRMSDGQGR